MTEPFITDPSEVTPDWLTHALSENGHLRSGRVTNVTFNDRMKADRQINQLQVSYSEDARDDVPETLIFKHSANGHRNVQDKTTCAGYREGWFYKSFFENCPELPIAKAYVVGLDAEVGQSHILLEDLTESHYLVPDSGEKSQFGGWKNFDNVEVDTFIILVQTLGRFHAHWWNDPEIHAGMFASSTGDLPSEIDSLTDAYVTRALEEIDHKNLDAETLAICRSAIRCWPDVRARYDGPLTLIHNDYQIRNLILMIFNVVGEQRLLTPNK